MTRRKKKWFSSISFRFLLKIGLLWWNDPSPKPRSMVIWIFYPQTFLKMPYLATRTRFHRESTSSPILHNHFPKRAQFIWRMNVSPNPLSFLSLQTDAHFTKWYFVDWSLPCHKKSRWSLSIRSATEVGHLNMERKYIGIFDCTDKMRVTLPPKDK